MAFPFDEWIRAGVTQLGLAPREVWAMSLRDLKALTQSQAGGLDSDLLSDLCALFPDGDDDG
jgi:hypothetical protein